MRRTAGPPSRWLWVSGLGLGLGAACARPAPTWPAVLREVRERHPEVVQISVEDLRERLDLVRPPLLLDARPGEEYALGHLAGAHLGPDLARALEALAGESAEREIVVYCSVGMRSSALAHGLAAHGFTHVANLEGGIFRWVNGGGATYAHVENGVPEARVDVVHPYDARWGTLLAPGRNALAR